MMRATLLLFAAVVAAGCEPAEPPLFEEIAGDLGIDFEHRAPDSGEFRLPEIMGGGAGWLDADGDGWLDAYLVTSEGPNRLYRNLEGTGFRDVTAAAAVGDAGYGMGCAVGDYDNDGHADLYVTNLGPNTLYRNRGDGTFENVTAGTGTGDPAWSTSAAFVDYDHDGDLDLFVTNYVDWSDKPAFLHKQCFAPSGARDFCSPQSYDAPSVDTLYRNDGDGTFTDVTAQAGLDRRAGTGLGIVCSDLNADGRVDLYVANDQMPSFAWINSGDGTFTEAGVPMSCAVDETGKSQAGMGVDAGDLDDDGDFDLWKVHLHREAHILYRNEGSYFDEATSAWNLAAPTRRYTGFGTGFLDYDLDGRLDLFVANGRVQIVPDEQTGLDVYAEPNQLLHHGSDGRFEDVTDAAGSALALVETSRAAAFGDFDNDGDEDVLVVNRNGPARLLRNVAPRHGEACTLRVVDEHGRDALGAQVRCRIEGVTRTFEVRSAYSYCAANDARLHVGIGSAEGIESIVVHWPDGTLEAFGGVPAGASRVLRRGEGAEPVPASPPGA